METLEISGNEHNCPQGASFQLKEHAGWTPLFCLALCTEGSTPHPLAPCHLGEQEIPAGDGRMGGKRRWGSAAPLLAGLQFGSGCIAPSSATDSGEPPLPQPQVLPGFSDTPPQPLTLSCPTRGDQGLPGAANLLLTKSLHLSNEPVRVWFFSWCGLDRYSNIDNK